MAKKFYQYSVTFYVDFDIESEEVPTREDILNRAEELFIQHRDYDSKIDLVEVID